jgi:hypothetical protein
MAYFDIMEKSISWNGAIRLSKNNPGDIEVDTSQLQVRIHAWASLSRNDNSHYLGYVQIITSNEQHNYYGTDVDQRWNFNKIPLSDSLSKAERPWYGVDSEPHIGGYRRYHLPKPTNGSSQFNPQMNMSDDFHMTIAKFETLRDGRAGPNALHDIQRDVSFRVWLVAVEESKVGDLHSYKRLMQLDWGYKFECFVGVQGADAHLSVFLDSPWHYIKFGDYMDPIPGEALSAPVGNENQQLDYYRNGVFDHTVVARKG